MSLEREENNGHVVVIKSVPRFIYLLFGVCDLLAYCPNFWVFVTQGNNDDMILSCCLHYCKDKARDFMPKSPGKSVNHVCFSSSCVFASVNLVHGCRMSSCWHLSWDRKGI